MAISTFDGFIAAVKQNISYFRNGARTTIAGGWFTTFDLSGQPGPGTLAGVNTANGTVPTDNTTGCPVIDPYGGGNKGYITSVDFGCNLPCRLKLLDMLFKAGAYAFNANVNLASQPSFASRLPNTDYRGLQLWMECVTAFTGNPTITVTYTNQAGIGSRTAVISPTAPTVGRLVKFPLQAGDSGIQKIDSVVATVASVGTFNLLLMRPLWSGRVRVANDGDTHELTRTGMPELTDDSALVLICNMDSTAAGTFELELQLANG